MGSWKGKVDGPDDGVGSVRYGWLITELMAAELKFTDLMIE